MENRGFLDSSATKNLLASAGDASSIPGLGRSTGERNGNPHQYSCLGNSMDSGAWWATVHRVAKSQKRLSDEHIATIKAAIMGNKFRVKKY